MTAYVLVAMFFYIANGVTDMLTANNQPRTAMPPYIGIVSFIINVVLFAWGAYLLA